VVRTVLAALAAYERVTALLDEFEKRDSEIKGEMGYMTVKLRRALEG
jgi:hypothetical protein